MLAPAQRRPVPVPRTRSANLPAPTGGVNTLDVGVGMPELDCIYAYNVIPAEQGLRARLGYSEWVTGLTGAADNYVRTMMAIPGNTGSKCFATTSSGIWGVTASTNAPTLLLAFSTTSGNAGYGTAHVMTTAASRYLLYCDEENGYYVYKETTDTWTKVVPAATTAWATSTAYTVGQYRLANTNTYVCSQNGTSSGSGTGPSTTGTGIVDGTAKWDYVEAVVSGVDPANLVHVTVWKNKVWLTEKATTRAWYLGTGAIFGTAAGTPAASFDFGMRFKSGGTLRGLYNWSYDGGSGMDTLLVAISSAGDVVMYGGTDPTGATTFGLKGTWNVGGVPAGRRIATETGGELLILSTLGLVPLSKLVAGKSLEDHSLYATAKVSNLFNLAVLNGSSLLGWAVVTHPTDNALLVLIPTSTGQPTSQLAMSFATRGWFQYRDLPMLSACVWDGVLYFGTQDGRVCKNTGYLDGVSLADGSSTPVQYSLLTAYRNLGTATLKRLHSLRTTVLSQAPNPVVQATAKFGFDTVEPSPPSGVSSGGSNTWDTAVWDTAVWGGDYSPYQVMQGAFGVGREVAIAVRGTAVTRTTLVGVDVFFEEGGML